MSYREINFGTVREESDTICNVTVSYCDKSNINISKLYVSSSDYFKLCGWIVKRQNDGLSSRTFLVPFDEQDHFILAYKSTGSNKFKRIYIDDKSIVFKKIEDKMLMFIF